MIQKEVVRKKKSSSFFATLGFFFFLFVLMTAGFVGAVYVYRDRLILEYVRDLGPEAFGFEALAVDSLLTRPVGQISVELKGLVFKSSPNAPLLRAERVLISTPKNLLGLYQLTFSREALPLKIQLSGLQFQTSAKNDVGSKLETKPNSILDSSAKSPAALPFPIELEAEFRDAQILFGSVETPVRIKNLTGLTRSSIQSSQNGQSLLIKSSGQLSMAIGLGAKNFLPIRTDWVLEAEPQLKRASEFSVQITSLTVSTLGMSLKSSGTLKWPEQSFSLKMMGSTPDLGVLPLDAAESEALGLSGRLKGSADLDIVTSGVLGGVISSRGLFRVRQGVFPFRLAKTKDQPVSITGPVLVEIEAPFDILFDMATSTITNLKLQTARLEADFTGAEVSMDGALKKPAELMMALKTELNAAGETIDVTRAEFRLANFLTRASGKVSLSPNRTSTIEVTATLPSLTGWPSLLPLLGQPANAGPALPSVVAAKGSFALKASAELPLSQPEKMKSMSKFNIEVLDVGGIELPLKTSTSARIEGILRGNFSAAGSVELIGSKVTPFRWNLRRAKGFFDLTDLSVDKPDLFSKKRSDAATVEFAMRGLETNPPSSRTTQIQIDRLDMKMGESTFSANGVLRDLTDPTNSPTSSPPNPLQGQASYGLDARITSRWALSQLYESLPGLRSMRAQVPSGTLTSNLGVKGTLFLAPEKSPMEISPLVVQGTVGLIGPRAILIGAAGAPSAKANPSGSSSGAAEKRAASFLTWPIFQRANLKSDVQFASVALATTEAKGFKSVATLAGGRLSGKASIATLFGGSLNIDNFSSDVGLMTLVAQGNYRDIDLSLLGEYFDPKWKKAVGGKSTGRFRVDKIATREGTLTADLMNSVSVSGSMGVKNGFFSTASIDQMVNQKIAEHPEVAKLMNIKSKVKTGGARLEMSTSYIFAKSVLNLRNLILKSPEKNEVSLQGWIKPDLSVDLKGRAFLADSPIGGSFRQANSDASGRLVIPIHLTGLMTEPSLSMAQDIISEMVGKTVRFEAEKVQKEAQKEATKVFGKKKNEVIDAVKEELKKRGLGF